MAGFDDVPEAMSARPPLTTVRQSFLDMATAAADYLIELASSPSKKEPAFKILDFAIIVRNSTAPPRSVQRADQP